MSTGKLHDFIYTPLFCEENIWQLANSLISQGVDHHNLTIAFISNTKQQVAIFNQKSAKNQQPVIWDYHVILLEKTSHKTQVYDFDSHCDFPIALSQYLELSFPSKFHIHPAYQPQFRLIAADQYLQSFSSDRSHMLGIIKKSQFPDYAPIIASNQTNAVWLQQYINFTECLADNEPLFSIQQLIQNFHKDK